MSLSIDLQFRRDAFVLSLAIVACLLASPCLALEHVSFRQDGREHKVSGKLLLTAQDGGLMLLGRDGAIWAVQPDEILERTSDTTPFEPFSAEELSKRLLEELPEGFDVYRTNHYLIAFNTSREYAQWCGSLFERLYSGFTNYWEKRGFPVVEPEFPLVAIVFRNREQYVRHARAEVGEAVDSVIGYYSMKSNHMTMFDLSGTSSAATQGRGSISVQIQRILSQPGAAWNVATIVHEAAHQIAFNCGLHARFSDCPRWFSEGIAMFFETPDLSSPRGWAGIGTVNRVRIERFRKLLPGRPSNSLVSLLSEDKRFLEAATSLDAYAEAWALTYFLAKQYPRQYLSYTKMLSAKKPMLWDDPQTRLQEFREAFGEPEAIDREFLRFMSRQR